MNTLTQRLVVVVAVLAWAHTSAAQTAEEIIEKSIAAMGGRAAMEKIKTRVASGTLSIGTPAGDITGAVEMFGATPNKQRMVIKADLTQFGMGSCRSISASTARRDTSWTPCRAIATSPAVSSTP